MLPGSSPPLIGSQIKVCAGNLAAIPFGRFGLHQHRTKQSLRELPAESILKTDIGGSAV